MQAAEVRKAGRPIDPASLAMRLIDPGQADAVLAIYQRHGLLPSRRFDQLTAGPRTALAANAKTPLPHLANHDVQPITRTASVGETPGICWDPAG